MIFKTGIYNPTSYNLCLDDGIDCTTDRLLVYNVQFMDFMSHNAMLTVAIKVTVI